MSDSIKVGLALAWLLSALALAWDKHEVERLLDQCVQERIQATLGDKHEVERLLDQCVQERAICVGASFTGGGP